MNDANAIPVVLLAYFGLALALGSSIVIFAARWLRRRGPTQDHVPADSDLPGTFFQLTRSSLPRPVCWLAVRGRNPGAVQSALKLHNPRPCSWSEGLAADRELFIAPPVNGWILVFGSGLPEPWEDVDACFRFVLDLSRKLGQVQMFGADRLVHHHSWIQAHCGRIVRAYAWAGKTIWMQGLRTSAERQLGLKCFDYTEAPDTPAFSYSDVIASNAEKVPQLAARWSLDPAEVDLRLVEHAHGIVGAPSRFY